MKRHIFHQDDCIGKEIKESYQFSYNKPPSASGDITVIEMT